MAPKVAERERAVALRKLGKTYNEILKEVPVAKSTLSLWLRDVGLAKRQKQRITRKRIESRLKALKAKRCQKANNLKEADEWAKERLAVVLTDPLMLSGVMLYWAEGSKEYTWSGAQRLDFINSDQRMVQLYITWLLHSLNIPLEQIEFTICVQETYRNEIGRFIDFWSRETGIDRDLFRVFYKKGNTRTLRKNKGRVYNGCLQVCVKKSTVYNRRVAALANHVAQLFDCRVV